MYLVLQESKFGDYNIFGENSQIFRQQTHLATTSIFLTTNIFGDKVKDLAYFDAKLKIFHCWKRTKSSRKLQVKFFLIISLHRKPPTLRIKTEIPEPIFCTCALEYVLTRDIWKASILISIVVCNQHCSRE